MLAGLLDNDLYKFTQQQAVWKQYPDATAEYRFINRRPEGKFTPGFFSDLQKHIEEMQHLCLFPIEKSWLKYHCHYFQEDYLNYLENFRYDPSEVQAYLTEGGELDLTIKGKWHHTILWEVPLMALISELYFYNCDNKWSMKGQQELIANKIEKLKKGNFSFADFGTRRRRNFVTHSLIAKNLVGVPNCIGTSNVHLAMNYNLQPIGTTAHEWTMGISTYGLSTTHKNALESWFNVYNGSLGIALTDTFTTDAFLRDFNLAYAKLYDGCRQDSGVPEEWLDKIVKHYQKLGIDPLTKKYVFSDGLDVEAVERIASYASTKYGLKANNIIFGIGTNLTNDFKGSPALNMVIKLYKCNDMPVVKLSDIPTKASGDSTMVKTVKEVFMKDNLND